MSGQHSKHKAIQNELEAETLSEMSNEQGVDLDDDSADSFKKSTLAISALNGMGMHSPVPIVIALLVLTIALLVPVDGWIEAVLYAVPFVVAGFDIVLKCIDNVTKKNFLSSEAVAVFASVILFCLSFYCESIVFLLLYRGGLLLEALIDGKCKKSLELLPDILPKTASVETAEGLLNVEPDCVNVGDIISVAPGEIIPLDGVIIEGITSVDTASISGQVKHWDIGVGYKVYSGCLNVAKPIRVRVTKTFKQSSSFKIVRMSEKAMLYKSTQEEKTEKVIRYLTPLCLVLSLFVAVLSMLDAQWAEHLRRSAMILIMSCPTVLSLSISLSYIKGLGIISSHGVFLKGLDCIESMAQSEAMIFDKTGTITEGRYMITDILPVEVSEQELLYFAGSAELFSRHPIASVLREAAGVNRNQSRKVVKVEEIPGRGVSAFVDNTHVYVGNAALLEEHGISCRIPERSGAAIHVAIDNKYRGYIQISDRIRCGAFDTLENLRIQGVRKMVLLTGDVLSVARPLASKLNFDMLRAELSPEGKLSAVNYLMANKGRRSAIAFIGDGYNDSELMTKVDVGIAMGALGSEAAFTSADVLIMDKDIKKLSQTVAISKSSVMIATENIIASSIVILLSLVLASLGLISVWLMLALYAVLKAGLLLNTLRVGRQA